MEKEATAIATEKGEGGDGNSEGERGDGDGEFVHALHSDHPLTLVARPLSSSGMSWCDACKIKWKNFTYNCSLCDFDLDPVCASTIESTTERPSHKHPLIFLWRPSLSFCDACGTKHEGCQLLCNGVRYSCAYFNYHLDVVCASLPNTIKHEAHIDHPISLKKFFSHHCNACHNGHNKSTFAYGCGTCDFEIHACCATYPSTVRHRYDEIHSFKLTYHPVEDHSDDYYYDICEQELNPLWWFYHCVDCDKSMHSWCHPMYDWRSKLRFGGVFTIERHSHPLSVVPVIGLDVQCNDYV
ncbi:hypothetical protein LguiB_033441 [Lonicera macranthoides]